MRYKKRKNKKEDILDLALGVNILLCCYIYLKTSNVKLSISIFFVGLFIFLAFLYYKSFKRKQFFLQSGINVVDKMKGEEFETFLLAHFRNLGYKGETTKKSHDYGADLILTKDNYKLVLQAKRWNNKVGIDAIQQINASISYYKADKGIVITNNYFTKSAYELAKANNIELWNRDKLIQIMADSQGKILAENVRNNNSLENLNISNSSTCPLCNSSLVLRFGRRGKFYGCSNYPKCKFTRNI